MACFVAPLVQAIATSIYRKTHKKAVADPESSTLMRHLPALEKMLWGGSVMLIVDHILNGELTWRFPFFTALDKVGGGAVILKEILTIGVPMCLVTSMVWIIYSYLDDKRAVPTT